MILLSCAGPVVEPGPRRRPAEPQIVGSNPTRPAFEAELHPGAKVTIGTYRPTPRAYKDSERDRENPDMTKLPMTTRIGVRRIVIEVNRDLTVEQIEMLDETLKRLGLVKATKVTLHDQQIHRVRPQRASHPSKLPVLENNQHNVPSEVKGAQSS